SVTFSRSFASTRSRRSRASSPSSRYSTAAAFTSIILHLLIYLVKRARPVVLEQPRQRAIGQQAAAGLALRAVVALVVGVDNVLDQRTANRTRLLEAGVHPHLRAG